MFLKNALEELEKSAAYIKWRMTHEKSFHSYCFLGFEGEAASDWQIGFYNPDDSISTFEFNGKDVKEATNDQIFKHPGAKVLPLDMSLVKLNVEDILGQVEEIRKKYYNKDLVMKTIVILQCLEDYGTVWNVTLITQAIETINIKIDATSGEVKYNKKVALIQKQ